MATKSVTDLHATLDAFHETISTLKPDSTTKQLELFAGFFAPQGNFYLGGMNLPPVTSRQEAIDAMKNLLSYWKLKERNVITRATSPDGTVAIAEMENELVIMGETLMFKEVEVAAFDEQGLIVDFKLYCDNKPIEYIIARKRKGSNGSLELH